MPFRSMKHPFYEAPTTADEARDMTHEALVDAYGSKYNLGAILENEMDDHGSRTPELFEAVEAAEASLTVLKAELHFRLHLGNHKASANNVRNPSR